MPIDLTKGLTAQLVTQPGFQSKFIRWFTYSPYSHVDLVLDDGTLLGARMDGGVKIRPANYGNFTTVHKFWFPVPNREKAILFGLQQIGKPYDWRGIVNLGFQERYWRWHGSWFCSELFGMMCEVGGLPIVHVPNCDRITPRDIAVSALGTFVPESLSLPLTQSTVNQTNQK